MSEIAVQAEGLGKLYQLGGHVGGYGRLTESIYAGMRRPFTRTPRMKDELWALRDVSFEIEAGSAVGVIGQNGAGKSTLLKILSRITEPTSGRAILHGRVGSLLEVGTGFHPELTGRENVLLNGAILGMTKREITSKFDEIVAFAGVERMIDTPVKRYSSGMHVRLAFSVAAHLQPEVMIVDEVLAVGDVAFQQKCLGKMEDASHDGRTVIFVSHNMTAVSHLCPRAILLDSGRIVADGDTEGVVRRYLATAVDSDAILLADRADRRGSGILRATSLAMRAAEAGGAPQTGDATEIEIAYEAAPGERLENVAVVLGLDTAYGQRVTTLDTEMTGSTFGELASEGVLSCSIPALTLNEGRYHVTVYITVNGIIADWVIKAGILTVHAGDFFDSGRALEPHDGLVVVDHTWRAH